MLLVANGSIFTRNAQTPFIPNGAVAIDGDTIVEVGPERELKAKYTDAEYVDAQGNLIMPGLINCHTHIYSGLARGLAIKGCNPTNFLENLEQQWWKIDDNLTLDGTKASAYATILDSIRDGVTTIFDHHASFCEIPGSLFTIKDAAQELGMRSCLCYEVSDRRGQEKCDQAIAENAEFAQWAAKERRDNDNHMIAAMFGGHATFTLSDETMDKMAEANNGLTGFHIHVCEGMNDVWDSRLNRGGISPVERLLQHNLLGPDTMLGHCIHVTPAEMDIVKESGTWLVNNPESNMGNAVGCAPVLEFFRRGIPVCIWGTVHMEEIDRLLQWQSEDGKETFLYPANEHCMVFVGYDREKYYFADPYGSAGVAGYPINDCVLAYNSLGSQAVVIMQKKK